MRRLIDWQSAGWLYGICADAASGKAGFSGKRAASRRKIAETGLGQTKKQEPFK